MSYHPVFPLENGVKPLLKWAGGKLSLLQKLAPFFPKQCTRYVEPFLGGGALLFSLNPSIPKIANDLNGELLNLYSTARDKTAELCTYLDDYAAQYSESFYYHLRRTVPIDPVQAAARTIFLNKTGFNGLFRLNNSGIFNVPFGKRPVCPRLYDAGNIQRAAQLLQGINLCQGDFELVFQSVGAGDFVYCDPPYEPLCRTSSFRNYTAQGFSQDDQKRLAACARLAASRGAYVLISNSTAPFILDLYKDYKIERILSRRAINASGAGRGEIEEAVICVPSS